VNNGRVLRSSLPDKQASGRVDDRAAHVAHARIFAIRSDLGLGQVLGDEMEGAALDSDYPKNRSW
jgi:hypothetical protein